VASTNIRLSERLFLIIAAAAFTFAAVYGVESQDRRRQELCTRVLASSVTEANSQGRASLLARCEVGEGRHAGEIAPRSMVRRQRG